MATDRGAALIERYGVNFSARARRRIVTGIAAAATVALAAGPATAATPKHREIKTVKISLGRVLAASNNHVLYLFTVDAKNKSHCDSTCRMTWMPVKSKASPVAGAYVRGSHLGLTAKNQVTYYGHPLYFYAGDSAPKQASGQGVGGSWYVVGTNGKAIAG
jgi:predicted lipoprotein with Yx(FWY)xxD motif